MSAGDVSPPSADSLSSLSESWVNLDEERDSSGFPRDTQPEGLYSDLSDGSGVEDMMAEAIKDSDADGDEEKHVKDRHSTASTIAETVMQEVEAPTSIQPMSQSSSAHSIHRRFSPSQRSAACDTDTSSYQASGRLSPMESTPSTADLNEDPEERSRWAELRDGVASLVRLVSSHPNFLGIMTVTVTVTVSFCFWWRSRSIMRPVY